eukprot:TRINITY_DN7510_c0_g2_i3.p1 TRINITY_DN7510_c0_g2~~TRINITY_DN7510_c0_g2_i3.p1  ORF type:complete len:293 (-),score=63.54 TRINITY_DN7510_c0_g2_i3:284-1162(-)
MVQFSKGNQHGFYHQDNNDQVNQTGYYHTYDNFKLKENQGERKIHVFLPKHYESSNDHFPVIYMNDGNTSFWNGPMGYSWKIQEFLSQNTTRSFIVVAICPIDREYEYTHSYWAPTRSSGGLEGYAKFLAEDVKPWIDSNYKTLSNRENTTILGSSHGGLAAFYIANSYPKVFGNCAALSPSFWAGMLPFQMLHSLEGSQLIKVLKKTLSDPESPRPKTWIDWGMIRSGGLHNSVIEALATTRGKEMVELLKKSFGFVENQNLFWMEDPAGEHNEISWNKRLPLVFKALYGQ